MVERPSTLGRRKRCVTGSPFSIEIDTMNCQREGSPIAASPDISSPGSSLRSVTEVGLVIIVYISPSWKSYSAIVFVKSKTLFTL